MSELINDIEAGAYRLSHGGSTEWLFLESVHHRSFTKPALDSTDLPSELQGFLYSPSPDGFDSNILILLHGLGDSPNPFASLGRTFALPQTAVLSLKAPFPLPFDLGHGWFDMFDLENGGEAIVPSKYETRRVRSLERSLKLLDSLIEALEKLGWSPQDVILFGYSQGGTTGLEWAARRKNGARFKAVVAVAAALLEERQWNSFMPPAEEISGLTTDFLFIAGRRDSSVAPRWVDQSVKILREMSGGDDTRVVVSFFDKGHSMIASQGETVELMRFLAPKLLLRSAWERDPSVVDLSKSDCSEVRACFSNTEVARHISEDIQGLK